MLKMDGLKRKFAFLRASARPTEKALRVYLVFLNQLERSVAVPIFSKDPLHVLKRNTKRVGSLVELTFAKTSGAGNEDREKN